MLTGNTSISLGMRDVDRDFATHIVASKASGIARVQVANLLLNVLLMCF
jgi:hypothetical protein